MLTTTQVSETHSLKLLHLPQIRSNAALLEALKVGLADLGLGDQLGASFVQNGKDVCGSLGVDCESLGIGVVDGIASLVVARILGNSGTLVNC